MSETSLPPLLNFTQVVERYDALLFDAVGVLYTTKAPILPAQSAIKQLNAEKKPYLVVSNTCLQDEDEFSKKFKSFGFEISPEQILSSGSLVSEWIHASGFAGARCLLLGPEKAHFLVKRDGLGCTLASEASDYWDLLIVTGQTGFAFPHSFDLLISSIVRKTRRGDHFKLLLPNPDIVYPKNSNQYGITAGGIASLIEKACEAICGKDQYPKFIQLGKPERYIFTKAQERMLGHKRLVMLGDQLETDILGANRAGIDSVLLGSGICKLEDFSTIHPTYIMNSLA